MIAKSSALSTFDLLRRASAPSADSQADGSGLQRARNGRRLALTGSNLADVGSKRTTFDETNHSSH